MFRRKTYIVFISIDHAVVEQEIATQKRDLPNHAIYMLRVMPVELYVSHLGPETEVE